MTKTKRASFSSETIGIISARSAYRCSFPGCDATLIGPGGDSNLVDNIGECAHIYAAASIVASSGWTGLSPC